MEGLENLATVRQAMNRCYMTQSASYTPCLNFNELDIEDPGTAPSTHFTYSTPFTVAATTFTILANRNSTDGGVTGSFLTIDQAGVRAGGTAFKGVK